MAIDRASPRQGGRFLHETIGTFCNIAIETCTGNWQVLHDKRRSSVAQDVLSQRPGNAKKLTSMDNTTLPVVIPA